MKGCPIIHKPFFGMVILTGKHNKKQFQYTDEQFKRMRASINLSRFDVQEVQDVPNEVVQKSKKGAADEAVAGSNADSKA
jgi:hypothetical protein